MAIFFWNQRWCLLVIVLTVAVARPVLSRSAEIPNTKFAIFLVYLDFIGFHIPERTLPGSTYVTNENQHIRTLER